ncbi:phage holin family protein [Xanthomarina gelatinilytica]|uniref:phage holin family protein n=1 Tax=Xanthomarina gelatinilytica TaxID=1137281 RepID=UPI003AA870F2
MITKITNSPGEMFDIVRKAFTFEHAALVPHSLGLALVFQDLAEKYLKPKIQVVDVLLNIFSEEVIRGLILTFFIFIAGMGMYIMVFVFDFITGLKASRKEHIISAGTPKGYVRSDKLWSSVWKFFAVIVISSILSVFSCALVFIDQSTLHQGGMLITLFFFFMVISFDVHSIGENQERMFGKKPEFYKKLDWFFRKVGDLLMLRIKSFFTGNSYDSYSEPYNDTTKNYKDNDDNEDLGNFTRQ